jgi:hypothetical protein
MNKTVKVPPFGGHYLEWRARRINLILSIFPDLKSKKIIELGAGRGQIGLEFSKLGAKVTFVEGRKSHCNFIEKTNPDSSVFCHDLNLGLNPEVMKQYFNIGLHFGLFYHLTNPWQSLLEISAISDVVFFETECAGESANNMPVLRSEVGYDQALNQKALRMNPSMIEKQMENWGLKFIRIRSTTLDSNRHFYNLPDGLETSNHGNRSMWIVSRPSKARRNLNLLKNSVSREIH